MNRIISILLILLPFTLSAQRSDGFFIQELMFIDPLLLDTLNVDQLSIEVYQRDRKTGEITFFLDSNSRLIKKRISFQGKTTEISYPSSSLSQFACPTVKPSWEQECENGYITKTVNNGSERSTTYDSAMRIVTDKWKPNAQALWISRKFEYTDSGLLHAVYVEDLDNEGKVDKTETYQYRYSKGQLTEVSQAVKLPGNDVLVSYFHFQQLKCGLPWRLDAEAYGGLFKAMVRVKYFSKGEQSK